MRFKFIGSVILIALVFSVQALANNALNFRANLSGDQEVPPVESDASGKAVLHVNQRLTKIRFKLDVRNATDALGTAGAHLHCAPAGENGPVIAFLAGSLPPGYDGNFQIRATLTDESIIDDGTGCGSTIEELAMAMAEGNVYINVHSTANPPGEIRGQIN